MSSKEEGDDPKVVELAARAMSEKNRQLTIECLLMLRAFKAIPSRADRQKVIELARRLSRHDE